MCFVGNWVYIYKVPHNKTGNSDRAKVLSFPKGKLRRLQKVIIREQIENRLFWMYKLRTYQGIYFDKIAPEDAYFLNVL